MKTKYDIICDPSHAWLKVDFKELVKLGIQKDISSFSYIRKDKVYLEEDSDLEIFYKAKESQEGVTIQFNEKLSDKQSKIRNYQSYNL